jgi:hypothetical protein
MLIRIALCSAFLLGLFTSAGRAEIIAADDFSSDGALVGTTPDVGGIWTAFGAAGVEPIQVTDGAAHVLKAPATRESATIDWGTGLQAGETVYVGFDVTVSPTGFVINDSDLFGAMDGPGGLLSNFIWLTTHAQGDFTLGLALGNSLEMAWSDPLTLGQTYRVVQSYDYDSKLGSLWIDPTNESSTSIGNSPTTFSSPYEQYSWLQGRERSGNAADIEIENFIVATTFNEAAAVPEPSSLLLGLAVGLGILTARDRLR